MDGGPSRAAAALAGATGAAVSLGVAEVASGLSLRVPSLVLAVGDVVVDHAPFGVVEAAISVFGTGDKKALVVGTVVLALAFGAVLGREAARRRASTSTCATRRRTRSPPATSSSPAARSTRTAFTISARSTTRRPRRST